MLLSVRAVVVIILSILFVVGLVIGIVFVAKSLIRYINKKRLR